MEYQEKVVCGKCKHESYGPLEVIETTGQTLEVEKPFQILVIKKYKCKKCKEEKDFTVTVVDKIQKKVAND